MEKRKWLWKRRSSDRSSGETESSGSISSHSERYSDEQEQDILKEYPNNNTQSPEVTSKAVVTDNEVKDSVKNLTEKLSAALVNVSAKEDLVKQHSKVAEEAVAGWEKAENEVAALKQQLEAAVQQNVALEVRANHLDGALKECVRQLRQAKEEQEQRVHDAVVVKTSEWESVKAELENKILELQIHKEDAQPNYPAPVDPSFCFKLDSLEKENAILKAELLCRSEELEIRTIERDLSTEAAETASKQQLESIKKLAKLEAECRRLQAVARKSSIVNDNNSIAASSICVESLTDCKSDSGEQSNAANIDSRKMSKFDRYDSEPSCSDSWASALIAELDQFKTEKAITRNLTACSIEIDMMDDFLEMERLAALPETKNNISLTESCGGDNKPTHAENTTNIELEYMRNRVLELEEKLEKIEAEKAELEKRTSHMVELNKKLVIIEAEKAELEKMTSRMVELKEKIVKIESEKAELEKITSHMSELKEKLVKTEAEKGELENMTSHMVELKEKLVRIEAEKSGLQNMTLRLAELEEKLEKIEAEKAELENALDKNQDSLRVSRAQLGEAEIRLEDLQKELASVHETKELMEFQLIGLEVEARNMAASIDSLKAEVEKEKNSSAELVAKCQELQNELNRKSQEVELQQTASSKVKQEDLSVAADKLAECQKTIASLGRQLESLATLEDFLIDTANLPGFSGGASLASKARGESWKLHLNDTFVPKSDSEPSKTPGESESHSLNGNDGESPQSSSSSTSSTNHLSTSKSRNGFGKLFSRSKTPTQLENLQG